MKRTTTRRLRPAVVVAELRGDTVNAQARTVDVTFYSGAPVLRYPLFDEPHELEFEVSPNAVRLDRLNAGASLVDSHATHRGVAAVLGVSTRAWLAEGAAHATVRFSRRPDVEPVWQDVQDGVLKNVSMGAYVHALEEVTPAKRDALARFRATDWEPYEISLVAVGADPGASIQAAAAEAWPCRIMFGGENMRLKKCPACSVKLTGDEELATCPSCEVDLAEAVAQRDEAARQGRIHQLAQHFGCGEVWGTCRPARASTTRPRRPPGCAPSGRRASCRT